MDINLPVKVIGIAAPQDIVELWNQLPYGKRSGIICEAIRTGMTHGDSSDVLTQYCVEVNSRLERLEAAMRQIASNEVDSEVPTWEGEQAAQSKWFSV